jgi:hypothetical protein
MRTGREIETHDRPLTDAGGPPMGKPMAQLRGDLRAQDRYGALAALLGEPINHGEGALLVMLARLLSDAEIASLIVLITRTGESAGEQPRS